MEYKDNEFSATDASEIVGNPLWNAALSSYDKSKMFGVRNNFNLEYRPFDFLYIRDRFGVANKLPIPKDLRLLRQRSLTSGIIEEGFV